MLCAVATFFCPSGHILVLGITTIYVVIGIFSRNFFPIKIMLICTDINNSGGINYPSYFAQKQTTVLSRTYLLGYNALTRCCKDQISHLCKPSSQTTTDLYLGR